MRQRRLGSQPWASQNLWDGAGHYGRTAEAVERCRSLWLAEYGQDASGEELAELDGALADMLVNMQNYDKAIRSGSPS